MELIFWTNVSDLMKGSPLTDSKAITRSHQEKSLIYRKKKKKDRIRVQTSLWGMGILSKIQSE